VWTSDNRACSNPTRRRPDGESTGSEFTARISATVAVQRFRQPVVLDPVPILRTEPVIGCSRRSQEFRLCSTPVALERGVWLRRDPSVDQHHKML
jgi:hypothetical protein